MHVAMRLLTGQKCETRKPMEIRGITEKDHAAVRKLLCAAFETSAEADLVERLRASDDIGLELVTSHGGQVLAYVALSRMEAPARWLALAPVAVTKKRQRRGMAQALCQVALAYANAPVVVLGDPEIYAGMGFDYAGCAGMKSPYPIEYTGIYLPEDAQIAGDETLIYPAAFEGA